MAVVESSLHESGFWSTYERDEKFQVTAALFAHPGSAKYMLAYPQVMIMDCTYSTNKYNMPLLNIIGIDACLKSFNIASAFMSGESEEDYTRILQ